MGNIFSFSNCFSNKSKVTSIFGKKKIKLKKRTPTSILTPLYCDYPYSLECGIVPL